MKIEFDLDSLIISRIDEGFVSSTKCLDLTGMEDRLLELKKDIIFEFEKRLHRNQSNCGGTVFVPFQEKQDPCIMSYVGDIDLYRPFKGRIRGSANDPTLYMKIYKNTLLCLDCLSCVRDCSDAIDDFEYVEKPVWFVSYYEGKPTNKLTVKDLPENTFFYDTEERGVYYKLFEDVYIRFFSKLEKSYAFTTKGVIMKEQEFLMQVVGEEVEVCSIEFVCG